jgi:hypothetical protein
MTNGVARRIARSKNIFGKDPIYQRSGGALIFGETLDVPSARCIEEEIKRYGNSISI